MNTPMLVQATGATYRQLDHWARKGYLRPEGGDGSGKFREWPGDEIRVATVMTQLVKAGVLPEAAHRAARHDGELAPGIRVDIDLVVTA